MKRFVGLAASAFALGLTGVAPTACSLDRPCTPGGDGTYVNALYPKLSDYCMVSIRDTQIVPEEGVTPYDQTTPLFSDYATKSRTVWVPPGASASYVADGPFTFPVGTIVTKSFGWNSKWVETRVLVNTANGWTGAAYLWNDDQTEAVYQPGGTFKEISFTEPDGTPTTTDYLVPNKNECIKCHENLGTIVPIGLRADRINHDFAYATGSENQITHWTNTGILAGAPSPDQAPVLATYADTTLPTETRARAYLAANCAHCHSATGEARNTGLVLADDITNPYQFGQCKVPVAAGKAASDLQYDIVPGQPDQSIMIYRMSSTTPSIMMPEIGRSVVDKEGVQVVSDWIAGLTGTCVNTQ
jgi:uncharacterized repeat protein (TIGR03806 family)